MINIEIIEGGKVVVTEEVTKTERVTHDILYLLRQKEQIELDKIRVQAELDKVDGMIASFEEAMGIIPRDQEVVG